MRARAPAVMLNHSRISPADLHSYRPDIDGLRAVAVMAVVLYHAGVWPFAGGFVGVDVFFVISGYLITSLIVHEVEAGTFTLANFYLRRARRILPALFTVIVATLMAGLLLLVPHELYDLSASALWATFFNSNIYFLLHTGYFDAPAETKPLLHTWSLSIEEQFYFFWPLILVVTYRLRRKFSATIIALALCSFVASVLVVALWPKVAFYFAPLRAWELLLGGVLATTCRGFLLPRLAQEALAMLGAVLVLWGVFAYSDETLFPGATALAPCLGAAFIIYSGSRGPTTVNAILSLRPMVGTGLVSYSLYLWHWPILVFYRADVGRDLTATEAGILVAVSLALAVTTWHFVEQPFRSRSSWLFPPRRLVAACVAGAVFISGLGAAGIAFDGFPARLPEHAEALAMGAWDQDFDDRRECYNKPAADVDANDLCTIGQGAGDPKFLVWGDSHALALMPAFEKVAEDHEINGWYAPHTSCEPLLDRIEDAWKECEDFKEAVLAFIERNRVPVVVLAAEWPKSPERMSDFREGLEATLIRLTRSVEDIWILEDVPAVPVSSPPASLATLAVREQPFDGIEIATKNSSRENLRTVEVINKLGAKYPFFRIDLLSALCDEKRCQVEHQGRSLYRDADHLSKFGALYVAPHLDPVFELMETLRPVKRAHAISG